MAIRKNFWKGFLAISAITALLYGRHEIFPKARYKSEVEDVIKKHTVDQRAALKGAGRPSKAFGT